MIFYLVMMLPVVKESISKCKESQAIQTKPIFEIFILRKSLNIVKSK